MWWPVWCVLVMGIRFVCRGACLQVCCVWLMAIVAVVGTVGVVMAMVM